MLPTRLLEAIRRPLVLDRHVRPIHLAFQTKNIPPDSLFPEITRILLFLGRVNGFRCSQQIRSSVKVNTERPKCESVLMSLEIVDADSSWIFIFTTSVFIAFIASSLRLEAERMENIEKFSLFDLMASPEQQDWSWSTQIRKLQRFFLPSNKILLFSKCLPPLADFNGNFTIFAFHFVNRKKVYFLQRRIFLVDYKKALSFFKSKYQRAK